LGAVNLHGSPSFHPALGFILNRFDFIHGVRRRFLY
jgi:hypothetical protein